MNPLINTEGYVRGLTEFVECIQGAMKPGLDSDRTTVIDDIVNGTTLMSLDWGDTGPASVSESICRQEQARLRPHPGRHRVLRLDEQDVGHHARR